MMVYLLWRQIWTPLEPLRWQKCCQRFAKLSLSYCIHTLCRLKKSFPYVTTAVLPLTETICHKLLMTLISFVNTKQHLIVSRRQGGQLHQFHNISVAEIELTSETFMWYRASHGFSAEDELFVVSAVCLTLISLPCSAAAACDLRNGTSLLSSRMWVGYHGPLLDAHFYSTPTPNPSPVIKAHLASWAVHEWLPSLPTCLIVSSLHWCPCTSVLPVLLILQFFYICRLDVLAAWNVRGCSQALQSWSMETVCSWKQRCIEGHIAAFLTVKDIAE